MLFLTDIGGLREAPLGMARRLAAEGFVVLAPNIFFRSGESPHMKFPADFKDPAILKKFRELSAPLTPEVLERDAAAYVDFLASRPETAPGRLGAAGYCYSVKMALAAAAARPGLVGAVAGFHGGGLFAAEPSSPHRLLPRVKAALYFAHASDDRSMPAEAIAGLEKALRDWGGKFESETVPAAHGWTVPDHGVYDRALADVSHAKLVSFLRATLQ